MAGRRGACLTPSTAPSIRATMLPSKSHLIGSRPMSGARALARPSAVAASAFGSNIGTRETGGRRTQTRRFPSSSVVHADSGCPPRDGPRLTTPTTPTTPATLGWTDGRMDGWTDGRMDEGRGFRRSERLLTARSTDDWALPSLFRLPRAHRRQCNFRLELGVGAGTSSII